MKAPAKRKLIGIVPRHRAFYAAIAVGAVALLICLFVSPTYAVGVGANAMFITYLGLVAREFHSLTPEFLRQRASDADSPVAAIFFVTAIVVLVAVLFLFLALNGGKIDALEVAVSVASVLLGWFAVHTMAALHYAFEYYQAPDASPGKRHTEKIVGGLDFPDGDAPDGSAFLYFSYVIGMTAQVADVAVASNKMRRLVLVHGVFSFFFNTIIVAATVNVVVTVASG